MVLTILALVIAAETTSTPLNPWLDAGLLGLFGALAGVVGTIVTTKIKAAQELNASEEAAESKIESDRLVETYREIERLRGVFMEHLKDVQAQLNGIKAELKAEKDYTDELKEHIYERKAPPPPKRKERGLLDSQPIDLSKKEAIDPIPDPGKPDFMKEALDIED